MSYTDEVGIIVTSDLYTTNPVRFIHTMLGSQYFNINSLDDVAFHMIMFPTNIEI